MSFHPPEPTAVQCADHSTFDWKDQFGNEWKCFACWYPQMGGYVGKCVVAFQPTEIGGALVTDCCFDVYVWHDGNFPFHDGQAPVDLHHCSPGQFIDFGQSVLDFQKSFIPKPKEEKSGSKRTKQTDRKSAKQRNTRVPKRGTTRRVR